MRICCPTESNEGAKAEMCFHFGSAPFLTIYDAETKQYEIVNNIHHQHAHGQCHPTALINDKNIDVVLCRGMGRRALAKIQSSGIEVFLVEEETVEDAIRAFLDGKAKKFTQDNVCLGHHGGYEDDSSHEYGHHHEGRYGQRGKV